MVFAQQLPIVINLVIVTGWGARHVVAGLGFCALVTSYALRFNLSMAIVAMVKHRGHQVQLADGNGSVILESCAELVKPFNASNQATSLPLEEAGEFDWNEAEQGLVLIRAYVTLFPSLFRC